MADLDPNNIPTASDNTEAPPKKGGVLAENTDSSPMTSAQAEQILAELKTIKQNLLWVLLIGGFFAARSFFFHY
ncbi:MAG: hypothetical protein ACFCVB_17085 [Nodosilinea sp.]